MITPSDILSESGPLAELIPDYRVRPQQIEMAEAIAEAITNHESFVCEAGTGTGKTFAYLIPAILSGKKVIISTGTKHLQDQLFQRDLKTIQQASGRAFHSALLKGRANYLCLHRLSSMETDQAGMNQAYTAQLHNIRIWSQQSTSGDLAELTSIPEDAPVRKFLISTTDNCLGQDCAFFEDCFVFKARRQAGEADLTIVNHHLLLADMALREQGYGELLPVADVVIFDEAHQLPDLASQFFSQTVTSHQFTELIRDSKQAYSTEAADMPDFLITLDKLDTAVKQLRLSFGENENRKAWYQVRDVMQVETSLQQLMEQSMEVHQMLDSFANRGKELDNCFKRCGILMNSLDMFIETHTDDFVQWLEVRGKIFLLHQTPLDIAEAFQARMVDYDCLCIYTSATLTVKDNFNHYANRMGLTEVKQKSWPSPFNFKRQAMLYLPKNLPDPRSQGYTEMVLELVLPVLQITRGRAFFLFTSHRALRIAAELIGSRINFPVLVQGEAPRTELLESFRNTPHSVLLGTQSFWEGVDVKGQALSCVIIDKLPFATPDDPVLKARMKKMEEQGKNPFMDYQLPEAVITLKQGVGRLIRDADDYGVLMICDPRMTSKPYGKVFLNSLPEMEFKTNIEEVNEFFVQHETS
ncbi:MAG: ATP-dependent DNA helicase [Gammaproteobacteria bacterium]|jgi:ATP-dependent DNA helicase DinG